LRSKQKDTKELGEESSRGGKKEKRGRGGKKTQAKQLI